MKTFSIKPIVPVDYKDGVSSDAVLDAYKSLCTDRYQSPEGIREVVLENLKEELRLRGPALRGCAERFRKEEEDIWKNIGGTVTHDPGMEPDYELLEKKLYEGDLDANDIFHLGSIMRVPEETYLDLKKGVGSYEIVDAMRKVFDMPAFSDLTEKEFNGLSIYLKLDMAAMLLASGFGVR